MSVDVGQRGRRELFGEGSICIVSKGIRWIDRRTFAHVIIRSATRRSSLAYLNYQKHTHTRGSVVCVSTPGKLICRLAAATVYDSTKAARRKTIDPHINLPTHLYTLAVVVRIRSCSMREVTMLRSIAQRCDEVRPSLR